MLRACIEKRRRIYGQASDGDGGAGEKKEKKTDVEMVGQHQELSERELSAEEAQCRVK